MEILQQEWSYCLSSDVARFGCSQTRIENLIVECEIHLIDDWIGNHDRAIIGLEFKAITPDRCDFFHRINAMFDLVTGLGEVEARELICTVTQDWDGECLETLERSWNIKD